MVKFVPAIFIVPPILRPLDAAYPLSTSATSLLASDAVKARPEVTAASLSGPSLGSLMSAPSTVKEGGGDGFEEIVVWLSVSSRPPAAAATPCSAAIFATDAALMGE